MRSRLLTMTRKSLLIMAGLALGFAMPAFAEQTNPVDKQTLQEVEGIVARLEVKATDKVTKLCMRQTRSTSVLLASRPANKSGISRLCIKWALPSPRKSMMLSRYLVGREL
jgi:hypothetical protein